MAENVAPEWTMLGAEKFPTKAREGATWTVALDVRLAFRVLLPKYATTRA